MMKEKQTEKLEKAKAAFRPYVNPKQLAKFLDGGGSLANREEIADAFDYDWHARKLKFDSHFTGHVLMQATAYESTRDHQWAAQNDLLFQASGAAVDISVSGLAQANKNRPIEPLVVFLRQVMDAVAALPHRKLRELDKETWQGIVCLLKRVDLFDATTLTLPPKVREWAPASYHDYGALKLQLKIAGDSGAVKQILLTPGKGNDSAYFTDMLGDLEAQEGTLFVFDAGYWNKQTYQTIAASDNDFVTKLPGRIKPILVEERPVPEEPLDSGYTVVKDAIVHLDSENQQSFRLLEVQMSNGQQATLLSTLTEMPADHICLLYRYRWSIEIVFRWLRQRLQIDHFMSHNPTGILRQILTALIVWGLLVIANQDVGKLSPKQLWRQLMADLHRVIFELGYRLGLDDVEVAF
jgi:hypothetical protein